jgi:hypothetical protein
VDKMHLCGRVRRTSGHERGEPLTHKANEVEVVMAKVLTRHAADACVAAIDRQSLQVTPSWPSIIKPSSIAATIGSRQLSEGCEAGARDAE